MTAVLSVGSNLGERLGFLRLAVEVLRPRSVSPVYETTPVGEVAQGDFLNAVLLCELSAQDAWDLAQAAEQRGGRERAVPGGPRTLDVDVICAPPPVPPGLLLPHPRAHERAFVLAPWLDVDPRAVLPGRGAVSDLLRARGCTGVQRRDDLLLVLGP